MTQLQKTLQSGLRRGNPSTQDFLNFYGTSWKTVVFPANLLANILMTGNYTFNNPKRNKHNKQTSYKTRTHISKNIHTATNRKPNIMLLSHNYIKSMVAFFS